MIPGSAVLTDDDRRFVFVRVAPGRFERRMVEVGEQIEGDVIVREGLSPGEEVVIAGDVLVHAVQLANPDVAYRSEADQAVARETRRRLLADARTRGARLATAHLHTGFVCV